jgi:hypothetical protein
MDVLMSREILGEDVRERREVVHRHPGPNILDFIFLFLSQHSLTDRRERTRAPGLDVNEQDTATPENLLASGDIPCDSEADDRPRPPISCPKDGTCTMSTHMLKYYENEEFVPPLFRAITLRNAELVRILLAAGVDG